MSTTEVRKRAMEPPGFALVMESDVDLRAMVCSALMLEGHRVESVVDCAGALAWCDGVKTVPDEFLLALGAGEVDPDWETLRKALDEDAVVSRAAVIVLLTIQNGLVFPERARIVQKPFEIDELMTLVSSDIRFVLEKSRRS